MSIAGVKDVYPCNGVQTEFEITFPFGSVLDVSAFISNSTTGDRRRLIRNLDYTIEVRDDGNWLRLRSDDLRAPWPTGWDICIQSRVRIEQGSSQAMSPEVFAKRVNQLIQMFSQIKEQLDRTLHIGQEYPPLNLTSAPYAYIFKHSFRTIDGRMQHSFYEPNWLDSFTTGGSIDNGTMREPIVTYSDWPVDGFMTAAAAIVDGSMRSPIVTYSDWPVDGFETADGIIVSGTMIAPIVAYVDWPADGFATADAILVSGTMA